jgi:quinol monooxygenase YgiN
MPQFHARSALLAAALTLLVPAVPALAQQPERIVVTETSVKPDHWHDYIDLQKSILPAVQKSGVAFSSAWEPAVLGDLRTFVRATPLTSFAMFDSQPPLQKAMGDEAFERYLSRVRTYLHHTKRSVVELRPELSIVSGRSTPPVLAVVVATKVVPGKAAAYEALVKSDVLPAMKKAGVRDFWLHRTLLGSDPNSYTGLLLVDKFADLDQGPPMLRAMGPEGFAKFQEKLAGIVASQEVVVMRHRADLSYSAPRP